MSGRRGFLAVTAGAVVTAGMVPLNTTAQAADLDGELLAAYAHWRPWEAERKRVVALAISDPTWDARFDAYTDAWHAGMAEMKRMPARTPEGLEVKARVMRALLENHVGYEDGLIEGASPSEEFAWSLVNDMLGRVGA